MIHIQSNPLSSTGSEVCKHLVTSAYPGHRGDVNLPLLPDLPHLGNRPPDIGISHRISQVQGDAVPASVHRNATVHIGIPSTDRDMLPPHPHGWSYSPKQALVIRKRLQGTGCPVA